MSEDKIADHIFDRAKLWDTPNPLLSNVYTNKILKNKKTQNNIDNSKIYNHIIEPKFYSLYDTTETTIIPPVSYSGLNSRRIIKDINKKSKK